MNGLIERQFNRIGARAFVVPGNLSIDIQHDRHGAFFQIASPKDSQLSVVQVMPADRHLLLHAANGSVKSKFLCGHDERDWFVAAVPEGRGVKDVQSAKDALKPEEVWAAIAAQGVVRHRDKRKNAAFLRQGEWFFIPMVDMPLDIEPVFANEPIRRGRGKPHMCQFLYRHGGETVMVCAKHPNGISVEEFNALPEDERKRFWQRMTRNASVFVRGKVSHSDHATIDLPFWHKVVMNTENKSLAMQSVAFLD